MKHWPYWVGGTAALFAAVVGYCVYALISLAKNFGRPIGGK